MLLTGVGIRFGMDRWLQPIELDRRRDTFTRLQQRADTPEGKKLLASWLKFTIAEAYTGARGDKLTSSAQHRYLYGNGAPWDITDDLEEHLLSEKGPFQGTITKPRDAWINYYRITLQNAIDNGLQRPNSLSFDIPKPAMKRNVKNHIPFHWSVQGVTGSASRDILNTLGDYTVYSDADISQSYETPQGWDLIQHGGTFHIYDRHDWDRDRAQLIGGRLSAMDIADRVLRPLGADNPRELIASVAGRTTAEHLDDVAIALTGEDALRLQDEGLAIPFDITTRPREIRANIPVSIPWYFFRAEPTFSP